MQWTVHRDFRAYKIRCHNDTWTVCAGQALRYWDVLWRKLKGIHKHNKRESSDQRAPANSRLYAWFPSGNTSTFSVLEASVLLFFITTAAVKSTSLMYIIDVIRSNFYQRGDVQERICCMFQNDLQIKHNKYLQMLFDDTADAFLMILPLLWMHNMICCGLNCHVIQRNCCFPLEAAVKKFNWVYAAKQQWTNSSFMKVLLIHMTIFWGWN